MFADIKTAGCVQVPEVLLEQTAIGLRCWEREACGPGGGGALVGHGQVLGGMSVVPLPGWLTLGVGGRFPVCGAPRWVGSGGLVCRSAEIRSTCRCGRGSRVGPPALPFPEGGMGVP